MALLKKSVSLHLELLRIRDKQIAESQIIANVVAVLEQNEQQRSRVKAEISSPETIAFNAFDADLLERDRIFHIDHIRKICIDYRLRFLPSGYFKGGIPEEAVSQATRLENAHGTAIGGFHIVAPTKTFQLKDFNDPLLFAPIGNEYFYLVHKWGNDLSLWRKIAVWPFRGLAAFTIATLAISLLITWITPETNLSRSVPMANAIIFLFAFKSVFAVGLYSFFVLGKKFNSSIWDSVYYNN